MEQKDITQAIDSMQVTSIPDGKTPTPPARLGLRGTLLTWFTAWEIYPVVLVAAFLRFYQLGFTEFDTDQAVLWNMARVALTRGLIPTTGNLASIGTVNPPAFIYFLMVAATFTANPLAGAALTALLNVSAVILTYTFTRRYYGRLAGFVAAALTATAVLMVLYSRFIWQPNILAPLLVLYMLALFRGAVARRTGWFAPAVLLLGLAIQLSGSSIYLTPALAIALVLGYKTVRWRDLTLGILLLALIFSTYLVWEAATGYADLPLLLGASSQHAMIDGQAFNDYFRFLTSYSTPPIELHPFFQKIFILMHLHQLAMRVLIFASFALLLLGLGWERVQLMARGAVERVAASTPVNVSASLWRQLWDRWNVFIASPQRRGILLLLAWQLLPLLLLSRHSISLQVHYLLILMPGPFILIGLLVSQVSSWCASLSAQNRALRLVVPTLAVLLILLQTLGSVAWLLNNTDGNHISTANTSNTLQDLRNAVQTTDQLASKHHLQHIYIDTDARTVDALNYLAQQTQTPNTLMLNNISHCLPLPATSQGPTMMLFGPTGTFDETLLTHFTGATLVNKPPRLGGTPFHIYSVPPLVGTSDAPTASGSFTLESRRPVMLVWRNPDTPGQPAIHMLVTFWRNHAQRDTHAGSSWTYHFSARHTGNGTNDSSAVANCQLTGLTPGEQLLVPFSLPAGSTALPTSLVISGTIASNTPYVLNYGPFHFQTLREQSTTLGTFQGTTGS